LRQTSSPTSPRTGRPSASTTSIAIPSAGPPSEHALIGSATVGDRKQAPTSVPPEQLMIGQRPPPTTWCSQRYGSGFHGSPVVTSTRSDERSCRSTSSRPCGTNALVNVGEIPSTATRSCSTSAHSRSDAGQSGAPSANRTVHPSAFPPTTSHGPMIQPMSVTKWITSPGFASAW
jgi:hypothetical protein